MVALIYFIWRKRGRQRSHHENGGCGLWQRNGTAGGANCKLTNYSGYESSKGIAAIVDDRNNYPYEQKTSLLNTDVNGDISGNGNIANHYRPDILLGGNDIHHDHPYDERNNRLVQNGTLRYDCDVGGGGWDAERV